MYIRLCVALEAATTNLKENKKKITLYGGGRRGEKNRGKWWCGGGSGRNLVLDNKNLLNFCSTPEDILV
jgi:hypothetical protein